MGQRQHRQEKIGVVKQFSRVQQAEADPFRDLANRKVAFVSFEETFHDCLLLTRK